MGSGARPWQSMQISMSSFDGRVKAASMSPFYSMLQATLKIINTSARRPIQVDMDRLDELLEDVKAYGVALGQMLFPQGASSYLDRALRLAQEMPVYMRLVVDDEAPLRYRSIRWETLRHPISEVRVTTSENIRFCRYLSNPDGTPPVIS